MKATTVSKLRRDFGCILDWIEKGETVTISKRGRIVAVLFPPPRTARSRKRPNFAARLKRIFGDRILKGDMVVEDRASRLY